MSGERTCCHVTGFPDEVTGRAKSSPIHNIRRGLPYGEPLLNRADSLSGAGTIRLRRTQAADPGGGDGGG